MHVVTFIPRSSSSGQMRLQRPNLECSLGVQEGNSSCRPLKRLIHFSRVIGSISIPIAILSGVVPFPFYLVSSPIPIPFQLLSGPIPSSVRSHSHSTYFQFPFPFHLVSGPIPFQVLILLHNAVSKLAKLMCRALAIDEQLLAFL